MLKDSRVNETVARQSQRHRILSNITNLSLPASWASNCREGDIAKIPSKIGSYLESQLLEENLALKRLVSVKDGIIERQAAMDQMQLDQMQKEFSVQLRPYKAVNTELISCNSRLSRDNGHLRDQLKLLQHEYSQMKEVYRINLIELQLQLAEAQELLERQQDSPRSDSSRRPSSVSREMISGSWPTPKLADNPPAVAQRRTPSICLYEYLMIGLDPTPEGSCEDDINFSRASTSEEPGLDTGDESWEGEKLRSGLTSAA